MTNESNKIMNYIYICTVKLKKHEWICKNKVNFSHKNKNKITERK